MSRRLGTFGRIHRLRADVNRLIEALVDEPAASDYGWEPPLDVIEHEIVPKTAQGVKTGSKLFGGGIIRKDDLSTVIAETNNEKEWPLFHGEVTALWHYWKLPKEERPSPQEVAMLATHEPCPLCLSSITWMGIDEFYYLFTYEDSRDEFGIPHDYRMLEENRGSTITVQVASGAVGGVLTPVEKCPQRSLELQIPP